MWAPRAVYHDYYAGRARARQVRRLHVIREDGPLGWESGKQTLCGQHAWQVRNSQPVVIDPMPARPPEGLRWCPKCIGHLAEALGLLDDIAGEVAAYDPTLTDPGVKRFWQYVDEQREVRRKAMEAGPS